MEGHPRTILFHSSCIIQKRNNSYTPPQPIFKQGEVEEEEVEPVEDALSTFHQFALYQHSTSTCADGTFIPVPLSLWMSDSEVLRNRLHVNLIQPMDVIHICLGTHFRSLTVSHQESCEGYWFCTLVLRMSNQMNGNTATPYFVTIKFPIKAIPRRVAVNYRSLVVLPANLKHSGK